jgi:UDP-N-acetylglucosamine--N-acetylmuramyl-(pentapeptide) pyrophosphoryl-undecaprenol N-acetylglucosamine transferase
MTDSAVKKTVLIMAGGTGGHVFPGLAVAQLLRERGLNVVWLGNPQGMEATLVPTYGFAMQSISFGGVRGKGLLTKLLLPMNLLRAFAQSLRVLRQVKPDVVLGFGGYITFPAGMMAVLLGKPLVLHEQNSIAGLANKVLAKVADTTLVAFPGALAQAQWVGNPVRAELTALAQPQQRYNERSGPLKLLVFGGSLGAKVFNDTVPKALAQLQPQQRPVVLHQTGKNNAPAVQKQYEELGVQAEVREFIQDMASAYSQADMVMARAGAMTVSELAAVGVASLLVPFPHAVDDHQTTNAQFLVEAKAATLLPQSQLTVASLSQWFAQQTREQLQQMAVNARRLAKPDAAAVTADVCQGWARRA